MVKTCPVIDFFVFSSENQTKLSGIKMAEPFKYSGDPKSDHSKTGIIWKLDILEVGFRMAGGTTVPKIGTIDA